MGLFSKPVTDAELRDFRRGKPVRAAVAKEAAMRTADKRTARLIRQQIKKKS